METSLETELEMATNDDCLACVLLRRRLLALPSATPHSSLHLCCCPRPCSLATCRPRASPDGPLALTGNAPRPYGSQMHALVPRAGLAGKRASAARDLTDADCPRQRVADRQPRAVVYQRLARLSLRRRYPLAEQPRGAYDGRLRDRRVRRQRRQCARRGVVEALRRGGACVAPRRAWRRHVGGSSMRGGRWCTGATRPGRAHPAGSAPLG